MKQLPRHHCRNFMRRKNFNGATQTMFDQLFGYLRRSTARSRTIFHELSYLKSFAFHSRLSLVRVSREIRSARYFNCIPEKFVTASRKDCGAAASVRFPPSGDFPFLVAASTEVRVLEVYLQFFHTRDRSSKECMQTESRDSMLAYGIQNAPYAGIG